MIESCSNFSLYVRLDYTHRALSRHRTHLQGSNHRASSMPPRTMQLAVHNTTTAGSTEAREVWLEYNADERRWIVPAGRRRPATTVYAFARLVSWRMRRPDRTRSHSYSYSRSYSYRLACRARQHGSSWITSIPPYGGSRSSGRVGGGADRADAVACVCRAQQQQQKQQSSSTNRKMEAGAGAYAVYFCCSS